jgi:hypothetical protein
MVQAPFLFLVIAAVSVNAGPLGPRQTAADHATAATATPGTDTLDINLLVVPIAIGLCFRC